MRYAFDGLELDTGTRQLLRGGKEIHLSPKAFVLLATLVTARPRALTKDELLATLWEGAIVSEGNLSVLVAELRRALGDEARAPRFVRTVQRYGYAFVAQVDSAGELSVPDAPSGAHWLLLGRRRIELPEGDLVVGRDPRCEIHLDLPGVSRSHARVRVRGSAVTLEDLASKNGTSREGERIVGEVTLRDRDRLGFGPVPAVYRCWQPPGSTATVGTAAISGERRTPAS